MKEIKKFGPTCCVGYRAGYGGSVDSFHIAEAEFTDGTKRVVYMQETQIPSYIGHNISMAGRWSEIKPVGYPGNPRIVKPYEPSPEFLASYRWTVKNHLTSVELLDVPGELVGHIEHSPLSGIWTAYCYRDDEYEPAFYRMSKQEARRALDEMLTGKWIL